LNVVKCLEMIKENDEDGLRNVVRNLIAITL
jgi:hypothetical protein